MLASRKSKYFPILGCRTHCNLGFSCEVKTAVRTRKIVVLESSLDDNRFGIEKYEVIPEFIFHFRL
jgi:hypothetical protein